MKRLLLVVCMLLTMLAMAPSPSRAAWERLDQSAPSDSSGSWSILSTTLRAQTFTAGLSGELARIDLGVGRVEGTLTIEIRETSNGIPTDTVLASSVLSSAPLAMDPIWFSAPANVTMGTQYAIVLSTDGDWGWQAAGNVYPGGQGVVCTSVSCWSLMPEDLAFATYVRPPDTTAPTGSIVINNDAEYTNSTSINATLTCQDAVSGCYEMDFLTDAPGATWSQRQPFAETASLTLPAIDGSRSVSARFYDEAGNVSATVSDSIALDTTAPDTIIESAPPLISNLNMWLITFSSTEPLATFSCLHTTAASTIYNGPCDSYSYLLSDDTYTLAVTAIDRAGNVDPTPATVTWTIDTVEPTVTINQASGQADPTNGTSVTFDVEFSEPVTGFDADDLTITHDPTLSAPTISVDPTTGPASTYTVTLSGLVGNGNISATVKANAAQDAATNSNVASTSTDNIVTIDQTAPTTTATVTGQEGQDDWYRTATVTLTADADVADTTYRINAGPQQTYTGPIVLPVDGEHTVTFASIDTVGNQESTKSIVVKVDGTAPVFQPMNDRTLNPTSPQGAPVVFTPVVTDNLSSASGLTATCVNQHNQPFVSGQIAPVGTTTITCTATDLAGNTASDSFVVTVLSQTDLLADLRADTITYVTNATAERALLATLDKIQQAYARGNTLGVYTSILTYVLQLERYVDSRAVSPANAYQLISDARQFLDGVM